MTTAPAREAVSDSDIIAASQQDPERFAALYDKYAPQLYRYACRRVGPEAAEDVVADTFLAAFRRRGRYNLERADARPWLFGILTKEISRRRRDEETRYKALVRARDLGDREPSGVDPLADRVAADVTARAARSCLATALADLRPGDRDVLLLFAWGGLRYVEIALALGIPVGTVRSRLNRARSRTRELLGDTDPTERD